MKTAQISAHYLDHLGSDLTVVNAARTSFGKESAWRPSGAPEDYPGVVFQQRFIDGRVQPVNLSQADAKLIRFLATGFRTNEWDALLQKVSDASLDAAELTSILLGYKKSAQHWAPFGHPHVQMRMKLPMFLARQFVKHQIGGVWSEESRRYMSSEPEFWFPTEWHGRPEDIKQGSDGVIDMHQFAWRAEDSTDSYTGINEPWSPEASVGVALNTYKGMLARGIAPEEARIILPLNTMTTVTWTGSLLFWSRVCNQRLDGHAQKAANELAKHMDGIIRPLFPVSWPELLGER
jgi:thymidylate synthase (FAD)